MVNYLDSPSVFIEYQPILDYTVKCLTIRNEEESQEQTLLNEINSLVYIDFNNQSFINSIQKYIKDINFIGNTFLRIPLEFETKQDYSLSSTFQNGISYLILPDPHPQIPLHYLKRCQDLHPQS